MYIDKYQEIKILLIAPKFFDYEFDIKNELEKRGAIVSYIQENIDSSNFRYKFINKLPKPVQKHIRDKYFRDQIDNLCEKQFDVIFGIRMELFDDTILDYIRHKFPESYYICYFWDSVKNMRNAENIAKWFDCVYTFDLEDAKNHDDWKFRPLFFNNNYKNCTNTIQKQIDILYVASLSPERAEYQIKLQKFCDDRRMKLYTYFYMKWYVFAFNRLKQPIYRKIPKNLVHGRGLSAKEMKGLFEKSKIVFDCSSISQSGLTMRTIECFGARKKMVTTNNTVTQYDIYDKNNIYVIENGNIDGIEDFLYNKEYRCPDNSLYNYYSISEWINTIFESYFNKNKGGI